VWFGAGEAMTSVEDEIKALREAIHEHNRRYYVESAPIISDLEYDRMLLRLRELELQNRGLVATDSPTQSIGDQPVPYLKSVDHAIPMLSIDNTYDEAELRAYFDRVHGLLPGEKVEWVAELKVDGAAIAITYTNGELTRAATRGNGRTGDDVTHNIRTVHGLRRRLTCPKPLSMELRGEIYMRNSDLERLNEQQQLRGEPLYKNTRNVASGSIRLLDPREAARRPLCFVCHGTGTIPELGITRHTELLEFVRSCGIETTPWVKSFTHVNEAIQYGSELMERIHELDFEIDGIVFKVNSFEQRKRLGTTSKSPRWVVAYKIEKYEATTRLHAIRVQVGKTGAITPVAELEPVELAGTTVSRASLHNADEIQRKDIRVGDVVVVEKAGKIIPHIVRVERHLRTTDLAPFAFPTSCPDCGTGLEKDDGGVLIRCPNFDCPSQVKERLRHFASRNAMDIENLGEKIIDQLVDSKLVAGLADLYNLKADQIQILPRMGEKSAQNLVDAISTSKSRGLARLLYALAIRHVGVNIARILARHFPSDEALLAATLDDLSAIPEIGPTIAASVYHFFHSPRGVKILDELRAAGIAMNSLEVQSKPETTSSRLFGKSIVVTGTLKNYTRESVDEVIRQYGGRASSSVSKKTDYVLAGENAGSKLEKAIQLGIPVLTEEEFDRLLT
jgi:DNA ligase (NAD+)